MIAKNERQGKQQTACGLGFPGLAVCSIMNRVLSTLKKVGTMKKRLLDANCRVDKSEAYQSAHVGPAGPGGSHGSIGVLFKHMSKTEE